ncbi:MAG: hypothetical protein L6R41_005708 [Letrouitia leprolyta]|nr:MAG: hypothetical protein L6R41_005708 [Letrouitia leprolyta]
MLSVRKRTRSGTLETTKISQWGSKNCHLNTAIWYSKYPTLSILLVATVTQRIPSHDLEARRAAREWRDRPWLPRALSEVDGRSKEATHWDDDSWSTSTLVDYAPRWDDELSPPRCSSPSPTVLSFADPLPQQPTITPGNQLLADLPAFEFCHRFSEPKRTINIPFHLKEKMANYLRRTVEAICFDWYRRWMPNQAQLLIVDAPDQLDLPAWTYLLSHHHSGHVIQVEAWETGFDNWMILSCQHISHIAAHHYDFDSDEITSAIRLAIGLKDIRRAEAMQAVVKTLYDDLTKSIDPDVDDFFLDIVPESWQSLKPQPNQFRCLNKILDLVCRNLIKQIQRNILKTHIHSGSDYAEIQVVMETKCAVLLPDNEKRLRYIFNALKSCRDLRNYTEHRIHLTCQKAEEMAKTAAGLMEAIGEETVASTIINLFHDTVSEMSALKPHDDLPQSILFLRVFKQSLKQLACWQHPVSSPQSSIQNGCQVVIRRLCHPFRYCMQPVFKYLLDPLIKKARKESEAWRPYDERAYNHDSRRWVRKLVDGYDLTAGWYDAIKAGKLSVDVARSPAVDYWGGRF